MFHGLVKSICSLLAFAPLLASCSLMHDDLEPCDNGAYLHFRYDYNTQRADLFNDHVGGVVVMVYDKEASSFSVRTLSIPIATLLSAVTTLPYILICNLANTNFSPSQSRNVTRTLWLRLEPSSASTTMWKARTLLPSTPCSTATRRAILTRWIARLHSTRCGLVAHNTLLPCTTLREHTTPYPWCATPSSSLSRCIRLTHPRKSLPTTSATR